MLYKLSIVVLVSSSITHKIEYKIAKDYFSWHLKQYGKWMGWFRYQREKIFCVLVVQRHAMFDYGVDYFVQIRSLFIWSYVFL
uniref:Uncharacterized protein n=1 Tax=Rhizophora mucronata TaxID=61149 RepID=A0A2P2N214_RHIMU